MRDFALLIKLGLSILAVVLFGDLIPEPIQKSLYTVSLIIKDTLVFVLPVVVFAFIFSCLASFQRGAPILVGILLLLITASNFMYTQFGFVMSELFLPNLYGLSQQAPTEDLILSPYFTVPFPSLITTDIALMVGTLAGLAAAFKGSPHLLSVAISLKNKVQWGLTRFFIPLIPLYILGFLMKIQHDGSLMDMITGYAPVLLLIIVTQFLAAFSLFFMANKGNPLGAWRDFRSCAPAAVVGFSTMSSAATMPVTLEVAERNTENQSLTQVVIPATTNIHLVGDSVAVPILLLAVYSIFGFDPMDYQGFLYFSLFYMASKFGVAAVPGGGMIVLAPLLQSQFGFDGAMVGLITALYILLDPFITASNVISNSGAAILLDRTLGRMPLIVRSMKAKLA